MGKAPSQARKAAKMDGKIDLLTLISLIVAVVLVLKLRSVLGRRDDEDERRVERARAEQQRQARAGNGANGSDKVVTLPRREREEAPQSAAASLPVAEAEERIRSFASADPLVAKGLLDILKLDPAFNPEHFVGGAKAAYEMIVTAFAEGNRKALKGLLSRDVFEGFASAIGEREARGEQIDQSFVGINKADILEAEVKAGVASVTVRFVSQLISATRERSGAVIGGDPQKVKEVTDIWTFSRDVSSARARQDPNWRLVATQAPN